MRVDGFGLVEGARFIASANADERPAECAVELLVIHNISLPPGEFGGPGIIDLFTNRLDPDAHPYYREIAALQVASHFLIRRDGELIQFVLCGRRAWHAGASCWRGRIRCNDYSLGVELEGTDHQLFECAQYERLAELTLALREKYPIIDIVGHSDIAPDRKTDPGPFFDWLRYRSMIANVHPRLNPHL